MPTPRVSKVAFIFFILLNSPVQAAITLSSTRVIFEGSKKEASVTVRNSGNDEILVQSWLDSSTPGSTSGSIPFAVTPPLARMAAESRQTLRILFKGDGVPTDKESVFWLNVQEIPKVPEGENILQLAVRQRIKFFYRPAGLPGAAKDAPEAVTWIIENQGKNSNLIIKNPTAFHVTLTDIQINSDTYKSTPIDNFMLEPGETKQLGLPALNNKSVATLTAGSIDDYGAKNFYSTSLGLTSAHLKPNNP